MYRKSFENRSLTSCTVSPTRVVERRATLSDGDSLTGNKKGHPSVDERLHSVSTRENSATYEKRTGRVRGTERPFRTYPHEYSRPFTAIQRIRVLTDDHRSIYKVARGRADQGHDSRYSRRSVLYELGGSFRFTTNLDDRPRFPI